MYTTGLLSAPGLYLRMGVVQISVANLVVIGVMVVVFVLALVLPFPHGEQESDAPDARG